MNNEWKLPSESLLPAGDRMDKDIIKTILTIHGREDVIQNQRIKYHEALQQSEFYLKEALRLLDRSSQSMVIGAMEDFNKERKIFLSKFKND
jgi:hypothetical protein